MPTTRALFLDRDGVINVERGYVHRREEFEFQDGIFDLCRAAEAQGYLVVVVTNQAGIGRGYYSESEFLELTDWMIQEFAERHVHIARVYYCPYHPVHGVGAYRSDSPDRKPKPGMLLRARTDLDVDLPASVLIGDKQSDIDAAIAAGVGTTIMLRARGTASNRASHCWYADSLDDIRDKFFTGPRRA
jgi:D-glycero-D-manno-heptose 1,7-bisphosphate phosphatase